ncbi:hypothetical protein NBRC116493_05920 [Aurantivibrio infirmus]
MTKSTHKEFIYQLFALIISFIIVHAIFVAVIRPNANAILQEQLEKESSGEPYVVQRSIYVVMKDYEQETCFVLMFWALAIMGFKTRRALEERKMLSEPIINISEGTSVLPEDARELSRPVQALPESKQHLLIPRALIVALQRFGSTRNIGDAGQAIKELCDTESERLDSELAMVRYLAWAIPSIGFIGTVRGIGEALGQAHKAVEGDIAGVTVSLGVAFNSTLIALVISIIVMFFSHQLQLLQERVVLDTQAYCDNKLVRHLRVRDKVSHS